ncbi:unnamed protein product [Lactuca virosa]|uniref:Uncharacterized protein n=1 Tax=Lactuca virosa TaxID=75947 RepID=A0AAU9M946_9ASTR|nr:unnamed protein product [Lactuca virosa]
MTEFHWLGHKFPISNAKTRVSILKAIGAVLGQRTVERNQCLLVLQRVKDKLDYTCQRVSILITVMYGLSTLYHPFF